jgi:hypothetical protein
LHVLVERAGHRRCGVVGEHGTGVVGRHVHAPAGVTGGGRLAQPLGKRMSG